VSGVARARVLIADQDASTRTGVRLALSSAAFDVCAEAETASAAVDAARRERPELCIVDANLPGDGVAAARDIVAAVPGTAVVMLGGAPDDERLFAALRGGARGYLLKDMDPARLPAVLRCVLDGEVALPRAIVGRVVDELYARERGRRAAELAWLGVNLTYRERDVLDLLDRGLDTTAIATRLEISAITVRRHVSEILRKLGAPDRESALRLVRDVAASPFRD
jgi:DNA-binding NarL/FixJ family response regulator